MFFDKIESLTVANGSTSIPANSPLYGTNPLNPKTWYDNNTHFTNDVQLQVGISLFLPTSFEYRLPK